MSARYRLKALIYAAVPTSLANFLVSSGIGVFQMLRRLTQTQAERDAIGNLTKDRQEICTAGTNPMMAAVNPEQFPDVDISVVTYNSKKWINGFVRSLQSLDYPSERLKLFFVDNGSDDGTFEILQGIVKQLANAGFKSSLVRRPNKGYGAGNNFGVALGSAPYCLITNIDVEFEPDSLGRAVSHALSDIDAAATWEFRQKPFEHPKIYDPISGATNWNSHACVLVRREAFEAVGGYDDNLFMYGEDVELSFRLRAQGFKLRYNPHAIVTHHAYTSAGEVKPVQYYGSKFANLYIRLLYGNFLQLLTIFPLVALFVAMRAPGPGATGKKLGHLRDLSRLAPSAIRKNLQRNRDLVFSFRGWDYDFRRAGAFYPLERLAEEVPKVSVITRTYKGREALLRQAMLSVLNQTYRNIELLVTEDRGQSLREFVTQFPTRDGLTIRYISENKTGRSDAGNCALAAATGKWCVFLDDDDLLYCDHVEVLASKLLATPKAALAFSLAFDVPTTFAEGSYTEGLYQSHRFMAAEFSHEKIKYGNHFPIQAVMFERVLYQERGGFDTDLDALEDWVLWQKYTYNNVVAYVAKTTSLYRTPQHTSIFSQRRAHFQKQYNEISGQMEAWRESMND